MTATANHLRRSEEAVSVALYRPEVQELMQQDETLVEFTRRIPRKVLGGAYVLLAAVMTGDALIHGVSSALFAGELAAGLGFVYLALREFLLATREFVCVTDRRLIYRKVNFLGRPARAKTAMLSHIVTPKLCQRAMAWRDTYQGEVLITLCKGKQFLTPLLNNGQFVLDAIRSERNNLSFAKRTLEESQIRS